MIVKLQSSQRFVWSSSPGTGPCQDIGARCSHYLHTTAEINGVTSAGRVQGVTWYKDVHILCLAVTRWIFSSCNKQTHKQKMDELLYTTWYTWDCQIICRLILHIPSWHWLLCALEWHGLPLLQLDVSAHNWSLVYNGNIGEKFNFVTAWI